ncbi:membrane-bound lytic murein transglycosylase MltF [Gallibacterium trehalosifermentans]|uniref:Membrane-bound lytic murein transglycosylase F n=1 Tax=Gallibacterium trehalosifermentans TaxID=516935 RepID=A0ABV6H0A0_9PAST
MKGLSIRIILAFGLLLWAIDMVFPWQKIMRSDDNLYSSIKQRDELVVGTINNAFSYFVNANGAAGLEYELTKAFADYLNVQLQIKTFDNSEDLLQALENNQIDLAAANLMYQSEQAEHFQLGPSYYSASWQLVYRKDKPRPYDINQLKGKLLTINNVNLQKRLSELKQQYPQLEWQVDSNISPEEALLAVANGEIDYTIANSLDVASIQQVKPNLAVGFDLTEETSVHWYLPKNPYNELQAALLDFMNTAQESGLISRIEEKYFSHLSRFDYVDARTYISAIENTLPTYLPLFQRYAAPLDWKLLAAISYQESHWDTNATSPTGVRGIMMLTKETANRMNIEDRTDPEQSIKAGAEYLHMLLGKMPETIATEDKIWFALVAYNLGLGHLLDVRRLTESLGGDPNNWLDVKANLPLLADKKYYSKLKFGYARGYEAYQYVENIRRYHNSIVNYYRIQEQTQ